MRWTDPLSSSDFWKFGLPEKGHSCQPLRHTPFNAVRLWHTRDSVLRTPPLVDGDHTHN